MADSLEEVAAQLSSLADTLGDMAITRLRDASDLVRAGDQPDPALLAEEKRITRARRAVEKAVHLLDTNQGSPDFGDGP